MAQRKAELLKLETLERLASFRAALAALVEAAAPDTAGSHSPEEPGGDLLGRRSRSF